jgi:hypothetical protein
MMILLIMLFVIMIAQAIVIGISYVAMRSKYMKSQQAFQVPVQDEITRIKWSAKRFMPDGTVHQLVYEENNYYQDDAEKKVSIYDVNDNLVWQGLQKEIPYQYLDWPERLNIASWYGSAAEGFNKLGLHRMLTFTPDISGTIEFPVSQNNEIKNIWRYLPEREFFTAYDIEGFIAGYLGATGFKTELSDVVGFGPFELFTAWCPEDSVNPVMLWQTDNTIYKIDFQKQSVEILLQTDKELLAQMSLKNWRLPESDDANAVKYRPAILSRTTDLTCHLIMRRPDQIFTFTPPADWNDTYVNLTATDEAIYLSRGYYGPRLPDKYKHSEKLTEQWLNEQRTKPAEQWIELYSINEKGELNLLNRYDWTVPPREITDTEFNFAENIKKYTYDLSPPIYNIIWRGLYKYWPESLAGSENDSLFNFCVALMQEVRSKHIIINWSISLILVIIALWHGWSRRTNLAAMISWLVMIAFFNIAGFLTYWSLNHTPVIRCSRCGKKRGIEKPNCIRCGAALKKPELRDVDKVLITQRSL